ncbi:MAG: UMP kinase [Planctomycetota bacterium]|nr:UMP kinase [Planctomycetota bacterium]
MTQRSGRGALGRVLLKLSGEALCARGGSGVDPAELRIIAREIAQAVSTGARMAVVVGGGNLIRGARLAQEGLIEQATADQMGMLGTVINAIALRAALEREGVPARAMSALPAPQAIETYVRARALRHLEKGRVVVLAGGVGHPYFTTDSGAALRAVELRCEAMLKATKVDGVYTADPAKDPRATRYESLTYAEALEKRLGVLDATALALCQENGMPTLVFRFEEPGNIARAVRGETVGTLVTA